jgi:hypothetical protein
VEMIWLYVLASQGSGILLVVRVVGVTRVIGVYWYRDQRQRAIGYGECKSVSPIRFSQLSTFLGRYLLSNNYCSWLPF